MNYGYMRVSTQNSQEFLRQEFAMRDLHLDKIFEEKISGTKKASNRPEFEKLLHELKSGDTVYFESMSRMARSMQDLIDTTNILSNKMKVRVVFLKENITIGGEGLDAMGSLVFNIMGAFAQFERDLIADRTKQALQAKKQQGMVLGAKKKEIDSETLATVRSLHDEGENIHQVCKKTGLGRRVVERLYKEFDEM